MNRALLRKAFADLRGHRLQTGMTFLILVASATTLTLSLTISRAAGQPWERAFEEANGAHITLSAFQRNADGALVDLSRAGSLQGVAETSGPYVSIGMGALIRDGKKHNLLVQEATATLPSVNRPLIAEGNWSSDPGEVVLDRALAKKTGIGVGDSVSVLGADGFVELRVAGLSVSPWRGPTPEWDPVAYVERETLRQLEPNDRNWMSIYAVRLADPQQAQFTKMDMLRLFQGTPVGIHSWKDVRDDVTFWNELNGIFLGMFSGFALVAAGLIVANLISARVLAQYRDIGLLKAVGFTPWQVASTFLIGHLLLALAASVTGMAIGVAIAPFFLRRLAEAMNTTAVPALDLLTAVVVPVGVLLVVAAFTIVPAWRGGRISTVGAITAGVVASPSGPSRLAWTARRLRLSPIVTLGLKDSFARPLRSLMTVGALVLTIVTIVFTLGVEALYDRVLGDPANQGEPYNIAVNPGRLSAADTATILDEDTRIASWHTRTTVRAIAGSAMGAGAPFAPEAAGFSLRAVDGNVRDAGYVVSEGRLFEQPGEAIIAWGLQERFGLRVGDTLDVTVNGQPVQLTITGRFLEDDNDGEVAMTSTGTLGAATLAGQPVSFLVNLRAGADEGTVAASLLQASEYQLDLWTRADEAARDAGASTPRVVLLGLSLVLLAIGLINLLSMTALSVRERMHDLGAFRAIGMTPAQVIASVMSSIGFLALLATVIGIPIGLWAYRTVFNILARNLASTPPEWYTSPPWWQVALVVPGAVLVAMLASAIPARHAARVEVATVLRYE